MIETIEQFGYQTSLTGFEDLRIREIDSDDLALQAMGMNDLPVFNQIESALERPADILQRRDHPANAADSYVKAANAYSEQGFYIKAAALKAKAALIYRDTRKPEIAAVELIDAICLDKLTDRFAKIAEELNGHEPFLPIRANYPNLFSSDPRQNELEDPERAYGSSNYVIFRLMNAHYALLMNIARRTGHSIDYSIAYADMYELSPERTVCYKHERRGGLFSWREEPFVHNENLRIISEGRA